MFFASPPPGHNISRSDADVFRRVPLLSINVLPSAAGSSKLAGSSSGANKVLDLSLPPGYGGDGDVLARVKEACEQPAVS